MADLRDLLKAETSDLHDRLEALPFFQALRAGKASKVSIVSFLQALAVIHAVLERSLLRPTHTRLAALTAISPPKVDLLVADLKAIDSVSLPSVAPAIQSALEFGAEILTSSDSTAALVGILYVLEGSQNGGLTLRRAYAACLDLPEERLAYIGCYGKDTARHWQVFANSLSSLVFTEAERAQIVQSAVRCFEALGSICATLNAYADTDLRHHVAAINCEAGDHVMPQNPLEIALALRTGGAAWQSYPYLVHRFGSRGRRFTSSDSCWLVALARMSEATVTKNLTWLRTVLTSRGIHMVEMSKAAHAGP